MTSAISSGLQGYDRSEAMVNNAAANVANYPSTQAGTQKPAAASGDAVDLSTNAVSLLQGKNDGEANLATIRVSDNMEQSAIDMLG